MCTKRFEFFQLQMKVEAFLRCYKIKFKDFRLQVASQLLFEMGIDRKEKIKNLSPATREKLKVVLVMSRKTHLYLIDEPIGGMDPVAKNYFLNTAILNYDPKSSIIIATNHVADIKDYIDDYIFLSPNGKLLNSGAVSDVYYELTDFLK